MHENVIWRDADLIRQTSSYDSPRPVDDDSVSSYLSGVVTFSPQDTLSRQIHVISGIHENGTLPTQFERERSEIFGSRRSDDTSDSAIPCIENVVPLEFEKLGCLLHSTAHDPISGRVKVLWK